MESPRYDLASGRISRLWSSRLWILAALLGIAAFIHMVGIVHDDRAFRNAIRATALTTAEQHAARVNERLQLLAMQSFAPISQDNPAPLRGATSELAALVAAQLSAERCQCRAVLPVIEFFRADVGPGSSRDSSRFSITRKLTGGAFASPGTLADSALETIARTQVAVTGSHQRPEVRLTLTPTLNGFAVATLTDRDTSGSVRAVYGFVAPAHTLMQSLFSIPAVPMAETTGHAFAMADTQSLQVDGNDSVPLYGRLSPDRQYRAKVFLHGPMNGLGVSVALSAAQAGFDSNSQKSDRLWALMILTMATVLVIVIAVTSSRKEMFLARARSDFIAGTSHDFRMPLAQILLAGETLQLRPEVGSDERSNLTNSIVRETHRLIAMVENVLLYSRSGAVKLKPTLQPVSVREVFDDVCDSVQLALEESKQTLIADVDDQLHVMADRHLLRQALVNLVDNAMKYGAPNQTIRLSGVSTSTARVELYVDDQGAGIPESDRARMFEPYERLNRDQVSARAGSGLGLAVVRQICNALNAVVSFDSAPHVGCRCVIQLQAAQA